MVIEMIGNFEAHAIKKSTMPLIRGK